jgi:hypothetical protein
VNKLLSIFLTVIVSSVFSQEYPKMVVIENDSCIIFTLEQSREMIVWDVEYNECKDERKILLEEMALKDSVITNQKDMVAEYNEILELYNGIKDEKDTLIQLHVEEKQLLEKQIKKQKRQKFISSALGVIATSILTTIILIK